MAPRTEPIGMGTRLGPYVLEQKIGQGGMGAVYRGRHERLPRSVAIKLLHSQRVAEDAVELFRHEVQQTCRLTHPSTVQIYDYGVTEGGICYYVMEYIDGPTVEELVDAHGPLPPGRVIYILAQLAHALAEAHEQGLVHRDIKPTNILLCDRGGVVDFPKLVDFGLVADLSAPIDPRDTQPRTLLGTPMYMAPEALTALHTVDARTDLYALGAVAYFMLTGRDVFEHAASIPDLMRLQLHQAPASPSDVLGRKLPRDLELVVMTCLAKEPRQRPADALALRSALLDCLDARAWSMRDAERWWAEHSPGLRRLRSDGSRFAGTSRDDTTRIPEWQSKTDRIR